MNICPPERLGKGNIVVCIKGPLELKPKAQLETILWVTELVVLCVLLLKNASEWGL